MITIMDLVLEHCGKKQGDEITGADCDKAGFDMLGGCGCCGATIAAYNAYPSRSGYWKCKDCITDDNGYKTVAEFKECEE